MNRELGVLLRDRLLTLPWVDKAVGLVKTIERTRTDDNGKVQTQRFPASLDVVGEVKPGEYIDAIPDSVNNRNLFYVEDNRMRVVDKTSRGFEYESEVRLVGWMNHNYQENGDTLAINGILNAIPSNIPKAGNLVNLRVSIGNISGVEDRIFSRYTYSEQLKQFLMAPYSAFAIDFTFRYLIAPGCLPEYDSESPQPEPVFNAEALSSKEILLTWV